MDYARGEGPSGASPFLCGGCAIVDPVPRCREWLVMQLPSRDAGSGWVCNYRPAIQEAVQDALPLKSEHSGT